ncbi:MAG: trypsin-like peptidase domain-containing protein [Candidatus Caenarcaniphilales bacterium]|nr:trypsin-like peptidase domain-containing protein [Candidatus Caenarcaniphilales bacterium]
MVGNISYQTVSPGNGGKSSSQSATPVEIEINGKPNVVFVTTSHGIEGGKEGNRGDLFVKQVDSSGKEVNNKISAPFATSTEFDLAVVDVPDDQIPDSEVVELGSEVKEGDTLTGNELLTGSNSTPRIKTAQVKSVDRNNGTLRVDENGEKFEKGNSGGGVLNEDNEIIGLVQGEITESGRTKNGSFSNRDGLVVNLTDSKVREDLNNLVSQIGTA